MKKILLLAGILLVAVFTTSCVNNFAVQELNNRAKNYMEKGDVKTAIARLESSLELDGSIFETRYNLAMAYLESDEFIKAQEQLAQVHKIKPEFVEYYYSLAVSQEGEGYGILNPKSKIEGDGFEVQAEDREAPIKLTDQMKMDAVKKFTQAVENYNEYLSKKPDAPNKSQVDTRIEVLNNEIKKYNIPADKNENVL